MKATIITRVLVTIITTIITNLPKIIKSCKHPKVQK